MWDDAMWCAEELAIGETNEMVLVDHGVLGAQQPVLPELTRGPSLAETLLVVNKTVGHVSPCGLCSF
jgi:hypothetical protein